MRPLLALLIAALLAACAGFAIQQTGQLVGLPVAAARSIAAATFAGVLVGLLVIITMQARGGR